MTGTGGGGRVFGKREGAGLIFGKKPMSKTTPASSWLFLFTFALTMYGVGASFVESFVNYPTWRLIGAGEFLAYHHAIGPLVIGYMVVPMIVGTIMTIMLVWLRPAGIPAWAIWLSIGLQLIVWISTAFIQLPIQFELDSSGLSIPLIDRLIFTNLWFRKVPQIFNTVLFLWMMSSQLGRNTTSSGGSEA